MNCGLYEIRCSTSGKRYVGSSLNLKKRFNEHRRKLSGGVHHSVALQRACDKYGIETLEFRVLAYVEGDMKLDLEQSILDSIGHSGEVVYNTSFDARSGTTGRKMEMTPARAAYYASRRGKPSGMLGKKHSVESKSRMSASQSGRKHTEETKRKIGIGNSKPKPQKDADRLRVMSSAMARQRDPKTGRLTSVVYCGGS